MTRQRCRRPPPNKRHVFTREECQRGYEAAKARCELLGWHASAWFFRRVRGWYRAKRRDSVECATHVPS